MLHLGLERWEFAPKLVGPGHGKKRPGRRLFWAFGLSLLPTILVCAVAITPAHCEPSTADMTIIVGAASKTEGACTRAARDYISRERLHAPRGYYLKAGCLEEKPAKSPRPIINTGVGSFAHIVALLNPRR
jgi:hypothetical protein